MPKMNDHQGEGATSATALPPRLNGPPAVRAFPVILMVAISLLLVGGLIFRDFLLGEKLLLYKDIGSDSVNDTGRLNTHGTPDGDARGYKVG